MFGTYNLTRSKNDAGYFTFLHNDMYIGQAIKNGKLWEPHIEFVLKNILDSNKSSINIGTHIGSHSVTMAKGSKKFYGFEPQPIIHWLMRLNLFDNGLNNFETFNNAVGNKRGMITLSKEDYWTGGKDLLYNSDINVNYGAVSIGKGGTEIEMITIDQLNIEDPISVILIDVEGAEPAVFWGAKEIIKKNRPSLVFERNQRVITLEMEEICELTPEIKNFKIEDFVLDLNYNLPISYGDDIFLIPMPENPFFINKEFTNGWKFDGLNFNYINRHPAKISWVKNNYLLVLFPDFSEFFFCEIQINGVLKWSNGDLWYPIEDSLTN